ncbi:hypothetical protein ACGF13_29145 [Kitasatospora sp. NPDC048286]|uniref:hypothetical protein n=1 Tax=Kitasatospora sp. NPDC048286 TaxID=3364047 RepID=UPI0037142A97
MDSITFAGGTLAVPVGISGSGKTTLAGQRLASWRVCLDAYREMATDSLSVKVQRVEPGTALWPYTGHGPSTAMAGRG